MPLVWFRDLRRGKRASDPYLRLQADRLVMTAELLAQRIEYRLPGRGLPKVAWSLRRVAGEAVSRAPEIHEPNIPLRVISALLIAGMITIAIKLTFHLRFTDTSGWDMLQGIESGIGTIIYLGVAMIFVVTLEGRIRRHRALRKIGELRALAHVIDMHQLSKDPDRLSNRYLAGNEYDAPTTDPKEMGRYLDYCADLLSLVGKVAVLYAHDSDDGVILTAVDEVERLTTGLSSKIWQKILVLDQIIASEARQGDLARATPNGTPHPEAEAPIPDQPHEATSG